MTPRARIIPVFVPHLGCPHLCVFCDQKRITGAPAPAGPEQVWTALAAAAGREQETELAFYGGTFAALPRQEQEALLDAAGPFVDLGGSIRLSTRPDSLTPEKADFLAERCVRTIELGCQSMDDGVLRLSGRGHRAADTETAARLVRERGLRLILQMMTGLPGDTFEKSLETARRLAELGPDGVRIYPTVILRGTPLYDMWKAGTYEEHTVPEAVRWCAGILPVFEERGIPVIRLGLNPTEDLSGGEAAGGAYHPAFGELVASFRFLQRERELLRQAGPVSSAAFLVHPSRLSAAVGHRGSNRRALEEEFPGVKVSFRGSENVKRDGAAVEIERPE